MIFFERLRLGMFVLRDERFPRLPCVVDPGVQGGWAPSYILQDGYRGRHGAANA